jgi:DNA-binding transcriptional MerR regulator
MAGMRSGELADAAGVNLQTLRYYERRGLLAEPRRSPGGHRLYPAESLTVLRVIKTAQRLGFTLDEVAELVDLGTHRHGRRPERSLQKRAKSKLAEIEAKIADLQIIAETYEWRSMPVVTTLRCARRPTAARCPLPSSTGGRRDELLAPLPSVKPGRGCDC